MPTDSPADVHQSLLNKYKGMCCLLCSFDLHVVASPITVDNISPVCVSGCIHPRTQLPPLPLLAGSSVL